jgi:hypothetical protein
MSQAFPSRYAVLGRIYEKGSDDYINRANAHKERATELSEARTVRTDHEVSTLWESPQQLHECAHEHDLADECYSLFMNCVYWCNRSLMQSYSHARLCEIRNKNTVSKTVLTLAEVAQFHSRHPKLCRDHSPPGEVSRSVLSSCHASNAPGLSASTYMETRTT